MDLSQLQFHYNGWYSTIHTLIALVVFSCPSSSWDSWKNEENINLNRYLPTLVACYQWFFYSWSFLFRWLKQFLMAWLTAMYRKHRSVNLPSFFFFIISVCTYMFYFLFIYNLFSFPYFSTSLIYPVRFGTLKDLSSCAIEFITWFRWFFSFGLNKIWILFPFKFLNVMD